MIRASYRRAALNLPGTTGRGRWRQSDRVWGAARNDWLAGWPV